MITYYSQCVTVIFWYVSGKCLYSVMSHFCMFRLVNRIYFYDHEATDYSGIIVQFLFSSIAITSESFLWTQFAVC